MPTTADMERAFHDIPDLKSVVLDASRAASDKTVGDPLFLRKMHAHDIAANPERCCIDDYVQRTLKRRKLNSVESDSSRNKSSVQDWSCDSCNTELVYVRKDAQRVCPQCGKCSFFQELTRSDMICQGYTPTTTYLYQRHNHFKTWLKRTQGKETTFIEPEVVDLVKKELKKERITDFTSVDHIKIKAILKKLRQHKYYNHWVQITTIVTGKVPPQMTREQENSLIQMFERVQEPFERKVKGKKRQNMLSYSFLIHKFLQIMSWDEYLPYFPLLVSADKIQVQDTIWQELCKEIGFEFIKSTM
jgi:predicted RNA-binding Zn-ribbon protein involved in translation (DUF1610 family)